MKYKLLRIRELSAGIYLILRRSRNWLSLACLSLIVLVVAACGDEATSTAGISPSPTASSATTSVAATVPPTTVAPVATTANATTTAPGSTSSSTVAGGLTMKAAYALADPQIKAWKSDAVYFSIFNPLDSKVGMDSEGRSLQWYFEVLSPSSLQRSNWQVKSTPDGKSAVAKATEDTLPKDRMQLYAGMALPPVSDLIDTDQLMKVARDNGGTKSDQPIGFRLARSSKEGEPLAFDLLFYAGDNVLRLRIDAQSGKLIENVKG